MSSEKIEEPDIHKFGSHILLGGAALAGLGIVCEVVESVAHVDTTSAKLLVGAGAVAAIIGAAVKGMGRLKD